jgi:hypothetical protein
LPFVVCLGVLLGAGPAFASGWGGAAGWGDLHGRSTGSWGAPPPPDGVVSSSPLSFPTTNGNVFAMTQIGHVLYLGGDFTTVTVGNRTVNASRVAAIDLRTNNLLSGFSASPNGAVRAMVAAPDRSGLFLGGSFSTVNGVGRLHVAEVVPTTGALMTSWSASTTGAVDGDVWAMVASSDRVYLGGDFTAVNGTPTAHVAAVDRATGALVPGWTVSVDNSPWDVAAPSPATDGRVQALALSPDGSHLYVGGYFTRIWHDSSAIVSRPSAASVFTADGSIDLTFAPPLHGGSGHLGNDPFDFVTGFSGRVIIAIGGQTNALMSVDPTTGARQWLDLANGDVQTATANGRSLYVGGHMHSYIEDSTGQHPVVDAAKIDPDTGAVDTSWNPRFVYDPTGGGTYYGVWSLFGNGSTLFAGGAFLTVGGEFHPHLAAFAPA